MSKTVVRWMARALVAGCLAAGTVVLGAGTSTADTVVVAPPPVVTPIDGTNSTSWIGGK
jgi:hypothetical protein